MIPELSHKVTFKGKHKFYKTAVIVLFLALLLSILMLLANVILPPDTAVTAAIITGSLLAAFLIMYRMLLGRMKETGGFEEMDIRDNKIYYTNEKSGEKIILPADIAFMRIYSTDPRRKSDVYCNAEITLKNGGDVFKVSRWLSDYENLIKKLRAFQQENGLVKQ